MESAPHVAIVIPCYKQARFLPDAIDSCLAQTYKNISIYVVNDGSPDNTSEVARSYGDRVTLIEQPNTGVNAARNAGIYHSQGEIIAFLDADDVLHPDCIEGRLKPFLEDEEVGSVAGWYRLVDENLKPFPDELQVRALPNLKKRDLYIKEMWSQTCGLLIRRRAIEVCGPFDPMIIIAEDWDLQMRIVRRFKHVYLPDCKADYRQVQGSASRNYILMVDCIRQVIRKNRAYAPSGFRYLGTSFVAALTQYSGSVFGKILRGRGESNRWGTLFGLFARRPSTIVFFIVWVVRGGFNRIVRVFGPRKGANP